MAAGYVLYSCSTELVFTLGRPVGSEFEIQNEGDKMKKNQDNASRLVGAEKKVTLE